MAIARASGQTAQSNGSSSAASIAITFPQNVVAGNFISACGAHRFAPSSMADGLGNTYALDVDYQGHPAAEEIALYSAKKLASGGSCTITWTPTGTGRIGLCAMEYSGFGADGAQLEDTATKEESASTTSVETNIASLASSEGLAVMFSMNSFDGVPFTYGSSFSTVAESNDTAGRCSMGDRILSAAGDYEGTATASGTGIVYAAALAIYGPLTSWVPEQDSTFKLRTMSSPLRW